MIEARIRLLPRVAAVLALVTAVLATPLVAQTAAPGAATEARLKKVESEVRALQRKVFPDGAGKFFEPEIAPPATAGTTTPLVPAGAPGTELIARIDAVEAALARATAQAEETSNRMGKLEARLAALEAGAAPATESPVAATVPPPRTSITGTVTGNTAAMTAASTPAAQGSVGPSAARLAAVAAIEKPVSTDKGEDDYLYGFRLWEAKFYPEAAQQLKTTTEKHPKHKRISFARNLLGRAWLDDGKPGTAAQVFLQNYQADKTGERAPDSLLYLAVAMTRLKETQRACVALAEFAEVYPQEAAGRLASQYGAAQKAVKCN